MTTTAQGQSSHTFKAEIRQLLEILVHSVYTAKDVFLRELISNSADAIEKVRFSLSTGQTVHSPDEPLEIRIQTLGDGDVKRLVISDTGIGMTEAEVHENIGTIAHSGATAFLEQLKQQQQEQPNNLSLIGRFGVGFYSVFMVAEKIVLTTRSADPAAAAVRWTSDGLGTYSVETLSEDLPRGTSIELHLRESETRFADPEVIRSTIKQYSNFISFPILVDGERANQVTALWREPKSQVTEEQYNEFYKLISHDFQEPLLHVHDSADAPWQYSALLYLPQSSAEVYGFGRGEVQLQLYVKRVLIDHENKLLLPRYLRFMQGVVESDDLPLNVSRETLQENRVITKIREALTKQVLQALTDLAKDQPETYAKFWETFGRTFREGYTDYAHRETFQNLLRFASSQTQADGKVISLADYVARMPEDQKAIYYLSGPSQQALARDARLELFRKRGIEVLYLDELADEIILDHFATYQGKSLISADKVKPEDLGAAEETSAESTPAATDDVTAVLARFKEVLGDRVTDVRTSARLVDSPACLVSDDPQLSAYLDKAMRMMNKNSELPKRALELNPRHRLIQGLGRLIQADPLDPFIGRACEQLFEGAMLMDGYLADPHQLVERMNQLLTDATEWKAKG